MPSAVDRTSYTVKLNDCCSEYSNSQADNNEITQSKFSNSLLP